MSNPLTDAHQRHHSYLRIAVTERCNLRCTYCMPADGIDLLPREHILGFDEIVRFAGICARHGVSKIRLTGGEPLVRRNLPDLVRRLRGIPGIMHVAMTTNGTLLANHAEELKNAGLDAVNISLDTLNSARFRSIARRDNHAAVLEGIDAALRCGFDSVKINTVVMRGINDDELCDFVELMRTWPVQLRFIEFMPFDSNSWSEGGLLTANEMRRRIAERYTLVELPRSERTAVAKLYGIEGFAGCIGFIASMSDHFCADCNRLRLTADGAVKACLFSQTETNIRALLRSSESDAPIEQVLRDVLACKWEAHPDAARLVELNNRSMIRIGG